MPPKKRKSAEESTSKAKIPKKNDPKGKEKQVEHLLAVPRKEKVKVVLLGQDPYHDVDQAHGLSFSVRPGVKIPPSLKNIYKELSSDIPGFTAPDHGCLEKWAEEGVLLLNATLTVQAHKPNSHAKIGWQKFTDAAITVVSDHAQGVVFLLWGGFAQKKEKLVDTAKHRVVKTTHPSPLSASKFKGCKCFSNVNSALKELGSEEVDWSL
ncbi:UNG [Branchiostoma lanceolatum]|uniref:Uracil-DNA glycosylase n=1 Tax=Branchiostoma lanceolatum TaxID=7740 RepID=A0A8J9YT31_BRALA|nr:UNG [Branchiostoma lanceolatum]